VAHNYLAKKGKFIAGKPPEKRIEKIAKHR
jgi:hypothetical protein